MDVSGVGSGPGAAELARAIRAIQPPGTTSVAATGKSIPVTADSVAGLLHNLSESSVVRLLGIMEGTPTAAQDARLEELLRAVMSAAAERDAGRTLEHVRELASVDPRRAAGLAQEPALASVRPAIEQLLGQLSPLARLHAEGQLAQAAKLAEATAGRQPAGELQPETLLTVAAQLIEAGGLANFVRSSAVSEAVMEQCRWAPVAQAEYAPRQKQSAGGSSRRLSLRVMILLWLTAGVIGAGAGWWLHYDRLREALELWAAGFFLLACLAVFARLRRD